MDAGQVGDLGLLILVGLGWFAFNLWNDRRVRYRCHARQRSFGTCRTPVARAGDRCKVHISRRHRSVGP